MRAAHEEGAATLTGHSTQHKAPPVAGLTSDLSVRARPTQKSTDQVCLDLYVVWRNVKSSLTAGFRDNQRKHTGRAFR